MSTRTLSASCIRPGTYSELVNGIRIVLSVRARLGEVSLELLVQWGQRMAGVPLLAGLIESSESMHAMNFDWACFKSPNAAVKCLSSCSGARVSSALCALRGVARGACVLVRVGIGLGRFGRARGLATRRNRVEGQRRPSFGLSRDWLKMKGSEQEQSRRVTVSGSSTSSRLDSSSAQHSFYSLLDRHETQRCPSWILYTETTTFRLRSRGIAQTRVEPTTASSDEQPATLPPLLVLPLPRTRIQLTRLGPLASTRTGPQRAAHDETPTARVGQQL